MPFTNNAVLSYPNALLSTFYTNLTVFITSLYTSNILLVFTKLSISLTTIYPVSNTITTNLIDYITIYYIITITEAYAFSQHWQIINSLITGSTEAILQIY